MATSLGREAKYEEQLQLSTSLTVELSERESKVGSTMMPSSLEKLEKLRSSLTMMGNLCK